MVGGEAGSRLDGLSARWRSLLWSLALCAAVAALVFGWFGYDLYFSRAGIEGQADGALHSGWDRVYASLLLLAFEFDRTAGVPVPVSLNAARYLALFSTIAAVMPFLDVAVRYIRRTGALRHAKAATDHLVIVGENTTARRLLALATNRTVVWVRPGSATTDHDPGSTVVAVPVGLPAGLNAIVRGARSVIVTEPSRLDDVHTAWAAASADVPLRPFLLVEVDNERAAEVFRDRYRPGAIDGDPFHIDVFHALGLTARRLVGEIVTALDRQLWTDPGRHRPATVLIRGNGPLANQATALLVDQWNHRTKLLADYVARFPDSQALAVWRDPVARELEVIREIWGDLSAPPEPVGAAVYREIDGPGRPLPRSDAALFLDSGSEANLIALKAAYADGVHPCWASTDAATWLFGGATGDLFNPETYGLDAVTSSGSLEDRFEVLARRVHFAYLLANVPGAVDPDYRAPADTSGARRRWEDLDEYYREQNRSQCRHFARYAEAAGLVIGRSGADAVAGLSAGDVEDLARLEHERWCAVAEHYGWQRGPRDDVARTHPDLVEWEELHPSSKDKDRQTIVDMPWHLASVDLGLYRRAAAR